MDYLTPPPASLTRLDDLANAMERKWGIDRLTRLVSPEAQARWVATLEACKDEWTLQADKDQMMMRAWRGMDAAATAAGAEPLPPGLWEQKADDGTIVIICRDNEHAQVEILRAKHDGRTVATWTLEEVVRVVMAQNSAVINAIKTAFPGATVERDRPIPRLVEDDPVPSMDEPRLVKDDPVPSLDGDDIVIDLDDPEIPLEPTKIPLEPPKIPLEPPKIPPLNPPPPPTPMKRKGKIK